MKVLELIKSKIGEWSIDKLSKIASRFSGGILGLTDTLFPIFVTIAIVGVLITMSGQRKLGTKVSSLSFIIYVVLRMVGLTYV